MATTTLICRLCKTKAIPTGCLSLFTNSAVSQNLAGRISELLDVCIDRDDDLPGHICKNPVGSQTKHIPSIIQMLKLLPFCSGLREKFCVCVSQAL